jgi:NAD(P)-dependent dehydrogenase (short-subunit alcohol dehydrogenase family)
MTDSLMAGRTVVITGGTGGIGAATALALAAMGAHLAVTGRDAARGRQLAEAIRTKTGAQVDLFLADLSDLSDVRRLGRDLLAQLPSVDVLVNNVGGYWRTRHVTADGLERTFVVNHLAAFLLTGLLLPRLAERTHARVVNVASHAHAQGKVDFEDLLGERHYSGARAYNQAKLATVLHTYELARRLGSTSVTVNALHPGVVRTRFGAEDPARAQRLLVPALKPLMKSPEDGALTSVRLASDPALARTSGRYFTPRGERPSSPLSNDRRLAGRLWDVSAELTRPTTP